MGAIWIVLWKVYNLNKILSSVTHGISLFIDISGLNLGLSWHLKKFYHTFSCEMTSIKNPSHYKKNKKNQPSTKHPNQFFKEYM